MKKKILKILRKNTKVSENVHDDILHELGWTEDEYEAGVRADPDTIELEEERPILLKKDGFSIITINKKDKDKSKEARNVFSHVSSKFFETMSQAQANFSVESVGVIVNTKLHEKYGDIKREFEKKWKSHNGGMGISWNKQRINFKNCRNWIFASRRIEENEK